MATRTAMIATTISISIRVKPFLLVSFLSIIKILLFHFFLYRPARGGRAEMITYQMLPYILNIGRYTASSSTTTMTASTMVMTGSSTLSSRVLCVSTSLSK